MEFDIYEWTPDLNEEFRTYEELQQLVNDFWTCDGVYPDGQIRNWETKDSVIARVESVLGKYLQFAEVAVVCHGMVISCLANINQDDDVPYCGIYEVNL